MLSLWENRQEGLRRNKTLSWLSLGPSVYAILRDRTRIGLYFNRWTWVSLTICLGFSHLGVPGVHYSTVFKVTTMGPFSWPRQAWLTWLLDLEHSLVIPYPMDRQCMVWKQAEFWETIVLNLHLPEWLYFYFSHLLKDPFFRCSHTWREAEPVRTAQTPSGSL